MAKPQDEFKSYIIGLLYPTEDIKKFVYDDINKPLEKYITDDMILGKQSTDKKVRTKSLKLLQLQIANFLQENSFYLDYLQGVYNKYMYDDVIFWVLVGFVLYRADKLGRLDCLDIFDEKNCILTFDDDILQKANLIKIW